MLIVLFAYSSVFGFYIDYLFVCANIKKKVCTLLIQTLFFVISDKI